MTLFDEYNYCKAQIERISTEFQNMGFAYDEERGWFNYYNGPLKKKQLDEIEKKKEMFKKYVEYSKILKKKLGM